MHPKYIPIDDVDSIYLFFLFLLHVRQPRGILTLQLDDHDTNYKRRKCEKYIVIWRRVGFSVECIRMRPSTTLQLIPFLWLHRIHTIPQSFRELFVCFFFLLSIVFSPLYSPHNVTLLPSMQLELLLFSFSFTAQRAKRIHTVELVRFVFEGMQ